MGLKFLPAEGPQPVAAVDSNDREEEIDEIGAADGFPELGAAELVEMETPAEMKKEVSGHQDAQSDKQHFPRLQCHEEAGYGAQGAASSRDKQCGSNRL